MADLFGPVVFVCTANVCRSPMAAALLAHALAAEPEPLQSLRVVSAGLSAAPNQPASANSVQAMQKVGLRISNHRSQALETKVLEEALVIYGMTESHRDLLTLRFPHCTDKIFLMRERLGVDDRETEIPDPFGMNLRAYESCRDSMVEAIPSIVAHLRELTGTSKSGT